MGKEIAFLLEFTTPEEMEGLKQPKVFRDVKYEKLRAIVDCTEFYIEKPLLPSSLRRTYSSYKLIAPPVMAKNNVSAYTSTATRRIATVSFIEKLL